MLELTDWIASSTFASKPWLVLGKGPTFDRRNEFDLSTFNLFSLNHVVNEMHVDVAHILDMNVAVDCAGKLAQNAEWLLMPRYPHLHSEHGVKRLEEWFEEVPILRDFDDRDRLVWYNVSGSRPRGKSPVIGARMFSSEAALNILGEMNVSRVRSLGIDGGRSYSSSFGHLEGSTLLENGATAFDVQFERLREIAAERRLDYRPLVEPLQVLIRTDDAHMVSCRVLEYSIRKSSSIAVEVAPISIDRSTIAELTGRRGRTLFLEPNMLVLGDVAELNDLTFGSAKVLHVESEQPAGGALMLLDFDELAGQPVESQDVAARIPAAWNHVEHFDPGVTKLLRYADASMQPWRNDDNPLREIWSEWYYEAVEAGAVPPEEVEASIAAGDVKASLAVALRRAPSRRAVVSSASLDLATARSKLSAREAELATLRQSLDWRIGHFVANGLRLPRRVGRKLARR